jgi:hypothetical protein
MFGASAMEAGGDVALESMTVPQLKEELAARGSARSGLKAALQRRLHSLLMEAAIGRQAQSGGIGMDRGDGSRSESLDDESGSMSESERSESEAGEDDESDSENMV